MAKTQLFKILSMILVGVITVLVIAIFILMLTFDPNQYKPQISQLVEKNLGRTLNIAGDLKLTLFPWLGVTISQVSLGNAKGFEATEFARVNDAQVRVKLLPLLQKRVEIGAVQLEGVTLYLTRKPDGHNNWEDFARLGGKDAGTKDSQPLPNFEISSLELLHAKVVWDDQKGGTRYLFSEINLETSAVILKQPITVKLSAEVESNVIPFHSQIALNSQVTLDIDKNHYLLNPLSITTHLQGQNLPAALQTVTLNTQLEVDLNQQTLKVSPLTLQALEMTLTGEIQVRNLLNNIGIFGQLQLSEFNLQVLLQQFKLPVLPSDKLLKKVALETHFETDLAQLSLANLHLQIDDNQISLPQLQVNLPQQTLASEAISIQALGMTLTGQFKVQQLLTQPIVSGKVAVAPVNPPQVLAKLAEWNLKPTIVWPPYLKTVAVQTQFEAKAQELQLVNFNLQVEDNQLTMPKLAINLAQQTLSTEGVSLQGWGLNLHAKLQVQQLLKQPIATGELTLAPVNPQLVFKHLGQTPPSIPAPFTFNKVALQTKLSATAEEVILKELQLTIDEQRLNSAQLTWNRGKGTLTLDQFTMNALGLVLTGTLRADQLLTQTTLQGSLKLAEFNPRQLLPRLGQPVPNTTDTSVLKTLALETQLTGNFSKLTLDKLKIRLDNSQLQGSLNIQDFKTRAVAFTLNMDQFDADRYLPPTETKTGAPVSPPSKKTAGFPLDYLHALNLNGTLKVGKLKVAKLNLKDVNLMVSAKEGQIKVLPQK
jgi:AsmA protein